MNGERVSCVDRGWLPRRRGPGLLMTKGRAKECLGEKGIGGSRPHGKNLESELPVRRGVREKGDGKGMMSKAWKGAGLIRRRLKRCYGR